MSRANRQLVAQADRRLAETGTGWVAGNLRTGDYTEGKFGPTGYAVEGVWDNGNLYSVPTEQLKKEPYVVPQGDTVPEGGTPYGEALGTSDWVEQAKAAGYGGYTTPSEDPGYDTVAEKMARQNNFAQPVSQPTEMLPGPLTNIPKQPTKMLPGPLTYMPEVAETSRGQVDMSRTGGKYLSPDMPTFKQPDPITISPSLGVNVIEERYSLGTGHLGSEIEFWSDPDAAYINSEIRKAKSLENQRRFWEGVGSFLSNAFTSTDYELNRTIPFQGLDAYTHTQEALYKEAQGQILPDLQEAWWRDKYFGHEDDMIAALKQESIDANMVAYEAAKEEAMAAIQEASGEAPNMSDVSQYSPTGAPMPSGNRLVYVENEYGEYEWQLTDKPSSFLATQYIAANNNFFQNDILAGIKLRNEWGGPDWAPGQQNPLWEVVGRQPEMIDGIIDFTNQVYNLDLSVDENGKILADPAVDWEALSIQDPYIVNVWEELGYIEPDTGPGYGGFVSSGWGGYGGGYGGYGGGGGGGGGGYYRGTSPDRPISNPRATLRLTSWRI